jgi:hypothetical protein
MPTVSGVLVCWCVEQCAECVPILEQHRIDTMTDSGSGETGVTVRPSGKVIAATLCSRCRYR